MHRRDRRRLTVTGDPSKNREEAFSVSHNLGWAGQKGPRPASEAEKRNTHVSLRANAEVFHPALDSLHWDAVFWLADDALCEALGFAEEGCHLARGERGREAWSNRRAGGHFKRGRD